MMMMMLMQVIECDRCIYSSLPGRQFLQCHYTQRSVCSAETYVVAQLDGYELHGSTDGNVVAIETSDTVHTLCRSTSYPFRSISIHPGACRSETSSSASTSVGRTLPASCFRPKGTGCDWYRDCLETEYPCSDSGYGYAIEFGDKYCRLFVRNYDSFSMVGRRWLDNIRKCLQVALVDSVLRAQVRTTCQDIRRLAFESHVPCYLHPPPGEPSFCDINLFDWMTVAWTLRSTIMHPSIAVEVIKGSLQVLYGCLTR